MKTRINFFNPLLILTFALPTLSHAEVTLIDQNDWKIGLSGFVEFDSFYDTTRSFVETVGSAPVARKGSFNGDNGRTQFSVRNSRLAFNIQAPAVDNWKTRGYIETDFLGFDPNPSAANPGVSEGAFSSNPTLRIRHAFLSAESNQFQILVGQTWSLFGWQPYYVLSSISVNPVSGTAYQRTSRISLLKLVPITEMNDLQMGVSLERPTQRDGKFPNAVAAIRWLNQGRKSGLNGPNNDIKVQPMGFGLSGTYRNFSETTSPTTSTSNTVNVPAFAFAVNGLLPILASSDGKDASHTLTATGEFTAGRGYGDEFPNGSGGLPQTYTGASTATTNNTNLDPGLGGYNNVGNFDLIKIRTWNLQLQYHLEGKTFFTAGYGQLYSSNIGDYSGVTGITAANLYDRVESKFINAGHDITPQLRISLEFAQFVSHYSNDGDTNFDNRYLLASYFRF